MTRTMKNKWVIHRLDPVKGDGYWSWAAKAWVSELDGGYTRYVGFKAAESAATRLSVTGWDNVKVAVDPVDVRRAARCSSK